MALDYLKSLEVIEGRLKSIQGLFRWLKKLCGLDGMGLVIIGRTYSGSTFGANENDWPYYFVQVNVEWHDSPHPTIRTRVVWDKVLLKSHAHKTICCDDVKLFGDPPGIFKQDVFGICKYFMASPPFMFISFWSSPPLLIPAHIYHRPPFPPIMFVPDVHVYLLLFVRLFSLLCNYYIYLLLVHLSIG